MPDANAPGAEQTTTGSAPESTAASATGGDELSQLRDQVKKLSADLEAVSGNSRKILAEKKAMEKAIRDREAADAAAANKTLEEQGQWQKRFESAEKDYAKKEKEWTDKHVALRARHEAVMIDKEIIAAAAAKKALNPQAVARLFKGVFSLAEDNQSIVVSEAEAEALGLECLKAGKSKTLPELVDEYLTANPNMVASDNRGGAGTRPPNGNLAGGMGIDAIAQQVAAMTPEQQREWANANPDLSRQLYEAMRNRR